MCINWSDSSLLKVVSLSYGANPQNVLFYKKDSPHEAEPIPKEEVMTTLAFNYVLGSWT